MSTIGLLRTSTTMIINLSSQGELAAVRREEQRHANQSSFILHDSATEYEWSGSGELSIKSFYGGQAQYRLGGGRYALRDDAYLVVNHGQPYTITIDSDVPVESFCLFFARGFAEEVRRSLVTAPDRLLSEPEQQASTTLHFFEKRYPHDTFVSPLLVRMRTAVAHGYADEGWLTEQFHKVMQQLLQVHWNVYREVEALPAARPATREELYRRLYRARDFAAASLHEAITLDDMAAVACLSPNHFLRSFRQAFGQTPHQYLTAQRLREAKHLLATTDQSVTSICLAVGFASVGTFSWLFRRHIGVSPEVYRRRTR